MVDILQPLMKVAIFDLEGTLVDSDNWLAQELMTVMKNLGVPITEQEAKIEGKRDKYALAAQHGISEENLDEGYGSPQLNTWEYALSSGEVNLYPETLSTLNHLKDKGVILGLLSRATRESDVALKVRHFGLEGFFGDRIVVVSDSVRKDEEALKLLGKLPAQIDTAYFIGDRAEDVTVADYIKNKRGINSKGIYVNRIGYPNPELANYRQARSLIEIPELVLEK